MSKRINSLFLFLVASLITIGLAEVVVRIVLPHPAFYAGHPGNVPGLVTPHPVLGYTYTPGFTGRMTTEDFSNEYTINELGLRDDPVDVDIADEYRILAVGNSFTAGEGVEETETWASQLERRLNEPHGARVAVRVINAGITGYSMRQMRLMVESLIPGMQPELVVVGLFPAGYDRVPDPFVPYHGHLVRTSARDRLTPMNDGFLYYDSDYERPWTRSIDLWLKRNFHFGAYLVQAIEQLRTGSNKPTKTTQYTMEEARQRLTVLLSELEKLNTTARRHHIPVHVLLVNGQTEDGGFRPNEQVFNSVIREYCEQQGIGITDPLPVLNETAGGKPVYRFRVDMHWNRSGHEVAATLLARDLFPAGFAERALLPDALLRNSGPVTARSEQGVDEGGHR